MKYLQKAKKQIEEYYKEKIEKLSVGEEESKEYEKIKSELESKEKELVMPKASFLFKLFRRMKYKKQLAEYDQKSKEIETLKKKVKDLGFSIEQKEGTIENLEEEKKKELAVFEGMDFNFSKNNSIKQKSLLDNEKYNGSCNKIKEYIDKLIKEYPNLVEDVEFMKSCVEFDMDYIQIDKTGSSEVYNAYLEQYGENYLDKTRLSNMGYKPAEQQTIYENYEKLKEKIDISLVPEGKYKIPINYVYEKIKEAQKTQSESTPVVDIHKFAYEDYKKYNGSLSEELGKTLLELYENSDNNYYYIYTVEDGKDVEEIKQNGIPIDESGKIENSKVTCVKGSEITDLYSFLANFDGEKKKVIAQVPIDKVEGEIIGYENINSNGRLLPEYIIGSVNNGEYLKNETSPKEYTVKKKNGIKPDKDKENIVEQTS